MEEVYRCDRLIDLLEIDAHLYHLQILSIKGR